MDFCYTVLQLLGKFRDLLLLYDATRSPSPCCRITCASPGGCCIHGCPRRHHTYSTHRLAALCQALLSTTSLACRLTMLRTPFVHTDVRPPCSPAFLNTILPVRAVQARAASSSRRPSSAKSSACSLIGSPLWDFTLIRNVTLPAVACPQCARHFSHHVRIRRRG